MKPSRSRLAKPMAPAVQRYTASIAFDRRLAPYDVAGSIAHARMLGKQRIIPAKDAAAIVRGLGKVQRELATGKFPYREELEDIHMNVEARLAEFIGPVAGKLHTGRSRNDQVALDMRMFVKDAVVHSVASVLGLQRALVEFAARHDAVVIPGYTHLQRGQPVLLAHHLLAYYEMLRRDADRFYECFTRADVMPLGSGAVAGSPYPLDRDAVAKELGFAAVTANSIDAVSDRDFVLDYHVAAGIAMMHCSRLAEELVLWSTAEFGFIEFDDAYATGSSLMPQKKNPDVAELARGKTGRVYGNLMAALTLMKGLPLSYNRDLQEDKEPLFDSVDTVLDTFDVLAEAIASITVNQRRTREAAGGSFVLATDLADYLVKKGMPFREAHGVAGQVVQYAIAQDKQLGDLRLLEYQRFSRLFDDGVLSISVDASIASRDIPGGTAPAQVKRAIAAARKALRDAH